MKIFALEASSWPEAESNGISKNDAIASIQKGVDLSRQLLPSLSESLNIAVRPYFQGIIPEYGAGARTWDSEFIEVWIDKTVPYGPENMLEAIYQSTLHECNHAARWSSISQDNRLLETALFEGLATVFERDQAKYQPLYGIYEDDETMQKWYTEINTTGSDWNKNQELLFNHSDGRRWVAYKTGTWLIDRALRYSDKTISELTVMPANEIVKLAKL